MAITLSSITSGYNTAAINANFQKVEDYINDILLARAETGIVGEAKMERDLDMDGYSILNADLDTSSITNDRAIRVPASEGTIPPLPDADTRKGKVLTFDVNTGLPIVTAPASGSAIDVLNQLALPTGANLVGYGSSTVGGTLNNVVTASYHTPEEFTSSVGDTAKLNASLSATASDGRTTWAKGTKSLTASITIPDNTKLLNDGTLSSSTNTYGVVLANNVRVEGGSINNSVPAVAVRSTGNSSKVSGLNLTGSVLSNTTAASAVQVFGTQDFKLNDIKASGYTTAVELTSANRTTVSNINASDMYFHSALGAGGYGVLFQGSVDSIVNNLQFVSGNTSTADGYTGRHAIYQSVFSGTGSTNTVVNNVIANYRAKTAEPAGGINIRSNTRGLWSNIILDGTYVSGNTADGSITSNIFSQGIIRARKFTNGVNTYGFSWGASTGGNVSSGNVLANSIISVQPEAGIETTGCFGHELNGNRQLLSNLVIDVPPASTPIVVRPGVSNALIANVLDPQAAGTAAFILFEGGSNITVSNVKTARPLFGGLANVTDLTVDFSRTATVSINSGTVTTSDPNSIISSVSTSSSNIVVNFNGHVTQAAVNNAIASIGKTAAPNIPIITSRGTKTLVIEFYALAGGGIVNPQTSPINFFITLSS